jgi:hypothetical protein
MLLAASACKTPSSTPVDAGGLDPDSVAADASIDARGPEFLARHRAYFLLQASHLRSAQWPAEFTSYDVFVCNPSLTADLITQIRTDIPGAMVLAYTDVQDIAIQLYPGNPYFDQLTAAFPEAQALHDLDTHTIIELSPPQPSWIVNTVSADALVAFHRDVTMQLPWDGMYVDESTQAFPQWKLDNLTQNTPNFDIDGDGVADTVQKLSTTYAASRPYFTAQLRAVLGPTAVVVGNAGGPLVDPSLNGITLERVGVRYTVADAQGYVAAEHAVATWPKLSVAWIIDAAVEAADAATLAASEPGVIVGDVLP